MSVNLADLLGDHPWSLWVVLVVFTLGLMAIPGAVRRWWLVAGFAAGGVVAAFLPTWGPLQLAVAVLVGVGCWLVLRLRLVRNRAGAGVVRSQE